ncbi:hypothetical protein ECEC1865_0787, partial [Escherichia coli EC1865]
MNTLKTASGNAGGFL